MRCCRNIPTRARETSGRGLKECACITEQANGKPGDVKNGRINHRRGGCRKSRRRQGTLFRQLYFRLQIAPPASSPESDSQLERENCVEIWREDRVL
ncbi:hypothetical protein KSP40_PGU015480 [Platanthera guangdongensis]|uniref:Uncharacterized protein n=1 Tax=Platanthera guangdongensis TaxID=2320717 RepID=A0ABR2LC74_9ASPA